MTYCAKAIQHYNSEVIKNWAIYHLHREFFREWNNCNWYFYFRNIILKFSLKYRDGFVEAWSISYSPNVSSGSSPFTFFYYFLGFISYNHLIYLSFKCILLLIDMCLNTLFFLCDLQVAGWLICKVLHVFSVDWIVIPISPSFCSLI